MTKPKFKAGDVVIFNDYDHNLQKYYLRTGEIILLKNKKGYAGDGYYVVHFLDKKEDHVVSFYLGSNNFILCPYVLINKQFNEDLKELLK